MKRFLSFLLCLLLMITLLSGCSGQKDESDVKETVEVQINDEEKSTVSTKDQLKATEDVLKTEMPSGAPVSNVASSDNSIKSEEPLSGNGDELVVTAYSDENVTLPRIQISSQDVDEINEIIYDKYHDSDYCNYIVYTDNNILSVIIFVHHPGGSFFRTYSVNTETKREMNNTDFLIAYNLNSNSVVEQLRTIEEKRIDNKQWANKDETYRNTLEKDNLNDCDLALGPNGLVVTLNEWTGVGSGGNTVLVDLQKESVYETLSDIISL